MLQDNVRSINQTPKKQGASRPDFSVLDSIIVSKFSNLSTFAFFFGFSVEQTNNCLRDLINMLFDNQKIDGNGNLFFPHNLYMQFLFMLNEQGGAEHILKHFVEFGNLYKNACLNGCDYESDNISTKISEAKYLLELHGYLVFNQLNFSPKVS